MSLLAVFSVVVFCYEHGVGVLQTSFWKWEPGAGALLYRVLIVGGLVNFPVFVAARIYIITETFVGLRRVQWGVYQTVQWSDYIPHY